MRRPSCASHSMMSQPRRISSRDWPIGLPCSRVIAIAMSSTRSRMSCAAFEDDLGALGRRGARPDFEALFRRSERVIQVRPCRVWHDAEGSHRPD